jgi:hypothetical protein
LILVHSTRKNSFAIQHGKRIRGNL